MIRRKGFTRTIRDEWWWGTKTRTGDLSEMRKGHYDEACAPGRNEHDPCGNVQGHEAPGASGGQAAAKPEKYEPTAEEVDAAAALLPQSIKQAQVHVTLRNPANHPGQLALYHATQKRIIIRAGRRGGKTTGAAMKAVLEFLKGKRVLYACPTLDQVQKFWKEVKRMLHDAIARGAYKKNETEHSIEKVGTEARIRAKTAWNAESLRGDYADVLILDEWQMMDETAWTEVGAPMLMDNNGNVIFIYTPPSLETRSASKAKDPRHAAKMYKEHAKDPLWLCIHFSSHQNPHISEEGIAEAARNMTRMAYRQEILAEDTEEIPGALWTRKILEESRVEGRFGNNALTLQDGTQVEMRRIVIAIDPSGGNTTEVGIVAAAEGMNGHYYVLRDASLKAARPKEWAQRACNLYYELLADRVIAERNYGGDMVEETLRNVDETVSYKDVNASKGKLVRAEPVLALFRKIRCIWSARFPNSKKNCAVIPRSLARSRPTAWMRWCGAGLNLPAWEVWACSTCSNQAESMAS